MAEKRDEELSRLYVLRAGISVIGMEDEAFLAAAKQEYDGYFRERDRVQAIDEEVTAKTREKWQNAETSNKAREEKKYSSNGKSFTVGGILLALLGAGLLFGCAMIIIGLCGYSNVMGEDWLSNPFYRFFLAWWARYEDTGWFGPVMLLVGAVGFFGGLPALFGGLFLFVWGVGDKKQTIKIENTLREGKNNNERIERELANLAHEKETLLTRIGGKDLEEFTKHYAKTGDRHLVAGEAFYTALAKEYKGFLDVRDWQYLDYLIYLYETGRADDIKEALHLLDRELQTERIKEAVENAAVRIERSIERGLANLQAQMETCFYRLSEEIRSSTRQIVASVNSIGAQMQQNATSMNAYLQQISSASSIGNALQTSANKSSAQLVKEVRTLREYASMMR